jgi:hypothetical protein
VPNLDGAPFVPRSGERRYYMDEVAGVAIAPLETDPGGALRVIVTTPRRIADHVRSDQR